MRDLPIEEANDTVVWRTKIHTCLAGKFRSVHYHLSVLCRGKYWLRFPVCIEDTFQCNGKNLQYYIAWTGQLH